MSFLWPAFLWGLALVPLLAGGYVVALRLRSRVFVAFPAAELIAAAAARQGAVRRHLPAACFLLALAAVVVALARPAVPLPVPADRTAVMLAIDVSGSMLSEDVTPSRLEAAKAAARTFVAGLPARVPAGLVTFAGDALLVSPPTEDHPRLEETIAGITVRHRTAIGDGLVEAVAALPGRVRPLPDGTLPPLPPGPRPPGVVVLLSDGQNNAGMDPLRAADIARREGVTVYTVGIGLPLTENRWVIGGPLDEDALRAIAQRTGGRYFHPTTGNALRGIYGALARRVGWETRPVEVTALAGVAAVAALLAALATSVRFRPLAG